MPAGDSSEESDVDGDAYGTMSPRAPGSAASSSSRLGSVSHPPHQHHHQSSADEPTKRFLVVREIYTTEKTYVRGSWGLSWVTLAFVQPTV